MLEEQWLTREEFGAYCINSSKIREEVLPDKTNEKWLTKHQYKNH